MDRIVKVIYSILLYQIHFRTDFVCVTVGALVHPVGFMIFTETKCNSIHLLQKPHAVENVYSGE